MVAVVVVVGVAVVVVVIIIDQNAGQRVGRVGLGGERKEREHPIKCSTLGRSSR